MKPSNISVENQPVEIACEDTLLPANLSQPSDSKSLVVCLRSAQTGRDREQALTHALNGRGFATLAMPTLDAREQESQSSMSWHQYNIPLLARRIQAGLDWAAEQPGLSHLPASLIATGTNTAAGIVTAARQPHRVQALVCRGGRPDLAGTHLPRVHSPILFTVGEKDRPGQLAVRQAVSRLNGSYRTAVFSDVGHDFHENGAWPAFIEMASHWLTDQCREPPPPPPVSHHSLILLGQKPSSQPGIRP